MSFFCTFSEIAGSFPARGLTVNGTAPQKDAYIGLREATCPQCGSKFSYTPGCHAYTRRIYTGKRERIMHFCRWSCVRRYDADHPSKIDRMIQEKRDRLEFLLAQKELPQSERTVTGDINRLIDRADVEYNRALTRKIWEAV